MNLKPILLATLLGLSATSALATDIRTVDSIAAVVGSDIITSRELSLALSRAQQSTPNIGADQLRQQVLKQMINQLLIVQAAKRNNIGTTEVEIDESIAASAEARKISTEAVYAQAAKDGLSRQALRKTVANSLITQKVEQQRIMQSANVSDAEVEAALQQAQQQNISLPEGAAIRQYRAQHILIKADNANAAEAAKTVARKLHQQARGGVDFGTLAGQYSQDGSAANGGDLGWFADGQMVPAFEEAVHQLKPGQISAPVRSQFGWHIIKLNEVRDAGTPEERRRNAVRQVLVEQKTRQATTEFLKELHENAHIDIRR
ncbi:MAG: peptidylprolyl isomerase [Neisseria sp.]